MQSELRKKLLEAFTNSEQEYVSGQYLADAMGCSRTAVWKHIEELRKEGFELEAIRKKGYKILNLPKSISADRVQLGLKTEFIGKVIHYEETVDSTQKIAHLLSHEGAVEGTVVIAEEQKGGRGRMDRVWHSPKSTGIWMSLILRPKIPIQRAPQLTLLTAVAIVQAIEECTTLTPQIKWPNDLLIEQQKVTGILTELQADADRIISVIVGMGLNINQTEEDFPPELREIATSLRVKEGKELDRAELIKVIFQKFETLYMIFLDKGFYPIKLLWESYAISIGKEITARTLNGSISGKALGITDEGVLKVEDDLGEIHHIYSADIELH
ncbi:biotin--[acetyl-CoA-carboxylase] ligase [Robertmurraya korlensis]|uniref:biotin--[acetyl-CoA-carboxylase] ligase n=1 Tax=Robertmurraya korlensis TaxID=519977 RepID=UPI00203DB8EA|nr:biotin--[acetyl-CoA-carboxylase] ligase [Robertmurraya korlensis]MCM3599804.1 biotin--[acetyl-CoA-carboxylase] ligase [Robertmurraya korlensis]